MVHALTQNFNALQLNHGSELAKFVPCDMCKALCTICSPSCPSKRYEQVELSWQAHSNAGDGYGEKANVASVAGGLAPTRVQDESLGGWSQYKTAAGGQAHRPVQGAGQGTTTPATGNTWRDQSYKRYEEATPTPPSNAYKFGVVTGYGGLAPKAPEVVPINTEQIFPQDTNIKEERTPVEDADLVDWWTWKADLQRLEDCVLVFYDFETTGLSVYECGLTECAAQRMHFKDGRWVRLGEKLEFFINPGMAVPRFITELTGITNEMVKGAVSLQEGLEKLRDYIAESAPRPTIPMAHNGKAFDSKIVRYRWAGAESFDPSNVRFWGDSISLFRLLSLCRYPKYALGLLYESCDGPKTTAHRAMADVRMMEYCINFLWFSRVDTFDSRLEPLHKQASTKMGAPPEAKLQNSTLFELNGP